MHKKLLWFFLFCFLTSCSSEQTLSGTAGKLKPFFSYTLLYQAGRQGVIQASKDLTTPYGGLDRELNAVTKIRSLKTNVIYVDAGNAFLSDIPKAELENARQQSEKIVDLFNLLQLDVLAPGPLDWKLGVEHLKSLSKKAKFKFVATNMEDSSGKRIFPAYQLVHVGNITIGFISITPEGWYTPEVKASSVAASLEKWVKQASVRADQVILLSQLTDLEANKKLLAKYPQVQIIVGNDPRRVLEMPENIEGRYIVDGYRRGYFLGALSFDFPMQQVSHQLLALDKNHYGEINEVSPLLISEKPDAGAPKPAKANKL